MSDFPELHEAYRRPTSTDTTAALERVATRALTPKGGLPRAFKLAALVAGLLIAYAAGFLSGRGTSRPAEPAPVPAAAAAERDATVRAPVLVAGPRS